MAQKYKRTDIWEDHERPESHDAGVGDGRFWARERRFCDLQGAATQLPWLAAAQAAAVRLATAAMTAVVPANSGERGGHGEHQWSKGSMVVVAARPWAAWSGGAPCSRRRPNRAAMPGGDAGDTPASDWIGKERGKGERRRYGGGKLEVSRRHSFVVRPRASVCVRVARAGRHELSASVHGIGARQQELARLGSAWLGLAV
uniref:Uncharacterized protein n=1 Tax=Oryza sativa subsp. japonica TaxID=39947 RepID=Q6ATU8_ORYSJ|nr:hypothetical protein [Oryza sativa Japonica Group]